MKRIVILGVIILVVAGTTQWFITREGLGDQGVWVPYAFGNAEESNMEMHILVDIGMMRREGAADKSVKKYEEGWIMMHWDMRNAAGEAVPFGLLAWSPLIDNDKCKAVPEFFIKYVLTKGEKYTLTYTPRMKTHPKVKYQFAFTAPAEPHGLQRVLFEPVKK